MSHRYRKAAVDSAIRQSRQRIGKAEARLIHAVLKGRSTDTEEAALKAAVNNEEPEA